MNYLLISFKLGKMSKLEDYQNIDWIPSQNLKRKSLDKTDLHGNKKVKNIFLATCLK